MQDGTPWAREAVADPRATQALNALVVTATGATAASAPVPPPATTDHTQAEWV